MAARADIKPLQKDRHVETIAGYAIAIVVALGAIVWSVRQAAACAWTCDDAFISFRYARNLTDGLGLVFNAGERVEGYTNFLWTLWTAAGLALGVSAESWANVWGIASYGVTIALLALIHLHMRHRAGAIVWSLPVAAVVGALHQDWQLFATSGLETASYTMWLTTGYLLVIVARGRMWPLIAGGVLFALAALTRPDGVLPAFLAGLYVVWKGPARWRCGLAYGLAFSAIWLPFLAWRVWYYGELLPNTYYAKSAYVAWYAQGWCYVTLYFQRYWMLLVGLAFVSLQALFYFLVWRRRGQSPIASLAPEVVLSATIALAYTFYILRVGGDFMFARMLIPAAPFYLIVLDAALLARTNWGIVWRLPVAACLLVMLVCSTCPVGRNINENHGIVDEAAFYNEETVARFEAEARLLGHYFADLPVRVCFYGCQARAMYRADVPVAIECMTGLTDRYIARQLVGQRKRVGHEKTAPAAYLVEQRKAHFKIGELDDVATDELIPFGSVVFPDEVAKHGEKRGRSAYAQILHWDPDVMRVLKERGAQFDDYPATLDGYLATIDDEPSDAVAYDYARARRFYFDHVEDASREQVFLRRLLSSND